ncbi:nitrate reductase [uncultured Shimia sp.]|uniref:nitrate reductase n=1 Tax=uncultured Shimia sp. TaxID=573152 RepID=UPI0026192AEF|nr:nitrate reductase [uncultured Shimia sp.]
MKPTKTTCPYCGVGCGVLAFPDGTIKGDPDHPANFGRLCSKGTHLGETTGPERRLLAPMVAGNEVSWDRATKLVAERFSDAIRDHGPDSVAFYVSGQLLTEDYYVANKLMKGFIGSANIDTNSRLCMASSVAGHKRAFGSDTVPGCYEDLEQADLVVLVGSNLAWCHPVLFQRLVAAKKKRPNMRVVNIDPRTTATSGLADMQLSIAPDGDTALFNALLVHLADTGRVNQDYVAAHVNGFDDAITAARTPGHSGLTPQEEEAFVRLWAATENVVTVYSQGVNQSDCGTDKVNAILNCHLATGRIGRAGMGPFSATGQPNAMGGREVGGLANMLANHLDLENPEHRTAVQTAWNAPTMAGKPGLKAVDLFQACAEGRIKALWIMSTNPAVSLPEADRVAEAISNVPFTVSSDAILKTDTNDLVDVLLPAAPWGEKSGTVTNSERCISRQRPFLSVQGQARPDWKIIADVAVQMGWGNAFSYTSVDEVFREYAELSKQGASFGRALDISGFANLTSVDYDTLSPTRWPVLATGRRGGRFFGNGGFHHPDGKARMVPVQAPKPVVAPAEFPFVLNTGRIRDQWHTMTRSARSPRLNQHLGEPFVELHPDDARALGLDHADLADITTSTGQATCRVRISVDARPGSIFMPMHWTLQHAKTGRVGPLVRATCDPVSGQPASKGSFAAVTPTRVKWYGFMASLDPIVMQSAYSAVKRTQTGWSAELADTHEQDDWPDLFRSLFEDQAGEVMSLIDDRNGSYRCAVIENGILRSAFFVSTRPVDVARNFVISKIGSESSGYRILAGRRPANERDPGAIVCSCMGVGINTISDAIAAGARDVEALGSCTGAGTNCGSCKPELTSLISEQSEILVAE